MIGRLQAPPLLPPPLLLLLLLPLTAGQEAPAARATDATSCQWGVWHGLPLATSHTPVEEYQPTTREYYQNWALNHLLPPFVLACTAAALLLAFSLWRLIKLASCVRCIRGPRHRSKAAADILGARMHRCLQVVVVLLAAGVVAGSGFGFSTIAPSLEPRGVQVYEAAKAYVADGLATANATVDSLDALAASVAAVRQRVLDLALDRLQPGILQEVDSYASDLASLRDGMASAAGDLQVRVLDHMQGLQDEWQPTADRLDVAKNALLYVSYAFLIAAAVAAALGVALNCPGLTNPSLFLLLALLVMAWGGAWLITTGLKVGSDGCWVVEDKILAGLQEAAERQVAAGTGVLATVGVNESLALGHYFLFGTGRNASQILEDFTGWSVWAILGQANSTVGALLETSAALADEPALQGTALSTLPDSLAVISADLAAVAGNVSALEAALSHSRFHALYIRVKQYACCDVLNWLGGLWLAVLVVGCCGVPLALASFWWVGRMDALEPRGCCHVYRRTDYDAFQEEEGSQQGGDPTGPSHLAAKPGLGPEGAAGYLHAQYDPEDPISASLRSKLRAAGAAGTWAGRGGGAAGLTPRPDDPSAPDAFQIAAVGSAGMPGDGSYAYQPQQQQRAGDGSSSALSSARGGSSELLDLLPAGTAAPARAPVGRYGSTLTSSTTSSQQWQGGSWVAATAAAGGGSTRGGGSGASSALNSARGPGGASASYAVPLTPGGASASYSVPLTPAAVAVLPPGQEPELSAAASEAALGEGEEAQSGGGSAIKRASRALARLRLSRRGGDK